MENNHIFYAARHGLTEWNREHRLQGHRNEPLSAEGLNQAHELGWQLKAEKERLGIGTIYTSDLSRAFITADVVSYYLGKIPVVIDRRLRERNYGVFEGKKMSDLIDLYGKDEVEKQHPEGGESLEEFERRIIDATMDILSNHHGKGVPLFVSHGGVIRTKRKYMKGEIMPAGIGFDIGNASFFEFEIPTTWTSPIEFGR